MKPSLLYVFFFAFLARRLVASLPVIRSAQAIVPSGWSDDEPALGLDNNAVTEHTESLLHFYPRAPQYQLALHRSNLDAKNKHWSLQIHPTSPDYPDQRWIKMHAFLTKGGGKRVQPKVGIQPQNYPGHPTTQPTGSEPVNDKSEHIPLGATFSSIEEAHGMVKDLTNRMGPFPQGEKGDYPRYNCVKWARNAMRKLAEQDPERFQEALDNVNRLAKQHKKTVRDNTAGQLALVTGHDTPGQRPGPSGVGSSSGEQPGGQQPSNGKQKKGHGGKQKGKGGKKKKGRH